MNDTSAAAKRELLARLLRERAARAPAAAGASPAPVLRRIGRDGALQLSFGQERIWVLEQLQPDSLFYNILLRLGLTGPVDVEVLRRSIEAVVARHEVLRARFPEVDGAPVQYIDPPGRWPMPIVDLRAYAGEAQQAAERRETVEEARTPFDLSTGPLLRTRLLRLADDRYTLVITIHHIISDGWSIDLFFQELTMFYGALVAQRVPDIADLPVQYPDFAAWQREWLTGAALETRRAYWARKLAGPLPTLELPLDRPRSTAPSFEGIAHEIAIDPRVEQGLRELSRREGVTLYTTLLTALKALLHRYSGQDDIVVGTLVAGRMRAEIEKVMGFFVNTLALRSDLSGDPPFREALRRMRDTVKEAHANADYPFERLVADLRPERDLSRSPFFQVVFNMLSYQFGSEVTAGAVRISPLPTLDFHAVTDGLTLFGFDRHNRLDFTLVYSPRLFNADTIERLSAHFQTLLAGVVDNPDARLSSLPLMNAAERERLLRLSRGPVEEFPAAECFPSYFEEQVRKTPDAIAVVDDSGSLTYAELNKRANRVARVLVAAGAEVSQPVGVCSERNALLLTWVLGIFKAGAAYLPLDPRYPADRHVDILRQSRARVVLVADELAPQLRQRLQDVFAANEIPKLVPACSVDIEQGEASNLPARARPQDLAYIIFTSGSTGRPKGAMVPHRAMLNHFWSKIRGLEITAADALVQSAPLGFDISVWQLLTALLAGGRVRIAPDAVTHEPARLFAMVRRENLTILEVVPSVLRSFLEELPPDHPVASGGSFGALRWLVLGGEALAPDLCRRWLTRWPQTPMINGYGPSECADDATRQIVRTPPAQDCSTISIGRPIHNVRTHILDRSFGVLPLGVAGELCIGGTSVGLGYLNDPERSDAAFIADPFGTAPARIYRTGDRARMRADGTIEFLGRIDFQVKIRGHRIELGEIEAVLARHPSVRQTVVVAWRSPTGDRLAAYIVPHESDASLSAEDLRAHAGRTLPAYMVPDAFVMLSALPLSPNGKIDRKALPAPVLTAPLEYVAPRDATEEAVAHIWAEVLRVERAGVHDNFFELGGHSLLATQVAARLRASFHVDLPVRALFERQTVGELAAYVAELRTQASVRSEHDFTEAQAREELSL